MTIGDLPSNLNLLLAQVPDMWQHVNKDEAQAELMRQLAGVQTQSNANAQAQQAQVWKPPNGPVGATKGPDLAARAREMFLKRMGGIRAELKVASDDFLACHVWNDQVYVFYCFGGRHGVTLEPIDLFPSDQLITQFRLVLT